METNSTNNLINVMKRKEINFQYGYQSLFKKYSYYQVVNAYKNLFIKDAEDIQKIKQSISNGSNLEYYRKSFCISANVSDSDLYGKICENICSKYGLKAANLLEREKAIAHIKYHHHIYNVNTQYIDFIRTYKFEHELRMILLKYILIIEENIKNLFISHLNDSNKPANYLSNMDSYNTSTIYNKSFETMKLIIDKHSNMKSKPIKRKRNQNLTVPYWILINELAMNQTYYAISNLNEKDSNSIFLKCLNYFTKINIKEENRGKNQIQIKKEQSQINTFKSILCYLGEFRNMLAHNQPIYCYNVLSYDINSNPKFEYELPKTNGSRKDRQGNIVTHLQQQNNINGDLMHKLVDFFGQDSFNSKNFTKLDLSKLIYIIYKILKSIDANSLFYDELRSIYVKYNIVITEVKHEVANPLNFQELFNQILELENVKIDSSEIISKIANKTAYKKDLKKLENDFDNLKKQILKKANGIVLKEIKSKYSIFPALKRYEEFTGINLNFFNDIK